jgi:hypothetical protein
MSLELVLMLAAPWIGLGALLVALCRMAARRDEARAAALQRRRRPAARWSVWARRSGSGRSRKLAARVAGLSALAGRVATAGFGLRRRGGPGAGERQH